ncbi:MAG: hypothetical protein LQ344_003908 [Seirophora lacunosa]|nr:MAG: hypothetical protein LQ344_003908 [Seirophora lacunosa]
MSTPSQWGATLPVRKTRTRTIDLNPPQPLVFDSSYTSEALSQRLGYADQRLGSTTRYLTPNSQKLLTIYRNTCADLHLEFDDTPEDKKAQAIGALRHFEIRMSSVHFLNDVSSTELLEELISLRQRTFWARYGHSKLRNAAAAAQPPTPHADTISGSFKWSQISQAIRDEEENWKRDGSRYPELVPTTYAVYSNCKRAGIHEYKTMIGIIHFYAGRNEAFHRGLQGYLEEPDYFKVAQCLYEDLRDLASVCPPSMADTELMWRSVLEQLRDDWFDISDGPDQPGNWNHKPAIKTAHERLRKSKAEHQRDLQSIGAKAANRLALDKETEDLLVQAYTQPPSPFQLPAPGPGTPTMSSKGKGKAKAAKPVDVSDQRKAWDTIMKQQLGQLPQLEMTLSKQREINRVVSAYRAAYGDDPPPSSTPT